MKKYLQVAATYAVFACFSGIFYREFTKFFGFTGNTALSVVHTHLFVLGMLFFLMVALLGKDSDLYEQKAFRCFFLIYNLGVGISASMLFLRGVLQVGNVALSSGSNAAISGFSGMGHLLIATGLALFFWSAFRTHFGGMSSERELEKTWEGKAEAASFAEKEEDEVK